MRKVIETLVVISFIFAYRPSAAAEDAATPVEPVPATWQSSIKLSGQIDAGIVGNFNNPPHELNFGQLFTDHANQVELNQVLITAQRKTDPKATDYDVGFMLQVMYGADARYTHFLGELDRVTSDRLQFDVVVANVSVHLPWLTAGGIDLGVGQYPSPMGIENIDLASNSFYSHSYIFNFGLPMKHTGVLSITHVTGALDLYLGIDSGENTTVGSGDNNTAPAGLFGFGYKTADGQVSLLALSHIGPENPARLVPDANSYPRSVNDLILTYKPSEKWAFTTEANHVHDDYAHADGYGAAQYGQYNLTPTLALNVRGEVWRDNKGYFVAEYLQNLGSVKVLAGFPTPVLTAAPTTYGEFTIGLTYAPTLPAPVANLMFRPELRFDRSLNGTSPYNGGRDHGVLTIAADAVLGF